jgi:hypothetical protein
VLHPKLQYLKVLFHPKTQHGKDVFHPKYKTHAMSLLLVDFLIICYISQLPLVTKKSSLTAIATREETRPTEGKERDTERVCVCVCVCVFLWEKRKRGSVRTELLQAHSMDQQQQHEDDADTFKCHDLTGLHKSLVQEAQLLHGLVCTIIVSKREAEPATFKKVEAIVSNFPMSLCLCLSLCLAFFFVFLGFFAAFWV